MGEPNKTVQLSGWGRIAPETCRVYRPERQRDLRTVLAEAPDEPLIARGWGRSYGDAAVNTAGVADMTRLNRMLDFDPRTGLLECEAGVGLDEIIETFLPRGFFLPVTPGTKYVTVGGAIANDVHGKNHHRDGAFSRFVRGLELLTASGESLTCSPDENADIFWATVGGVGLTGMILSAKIELMRVDNAYVCVDYRRCPDLEAALSCMNDLDETYPYSVAWVDCMATGRALGRSVLMHGRHAPIDMLPPEWAARPLYVAARAKIPVPVDFPEFALNPWSIQAFNSVFYRRHPDQMGVVVDYDKYFYPLDGLRNWNRMYGKRGFVQYQATVPLEQAAGLTRLLEKLSAARRASFLAVLKRFGDAGPGLLSYPLKGYTLALDIPNHAGLFPFLEELDRLVLDHGGRLYLAKDAAMSPESFTAMYPQAGVFREIRDRLDPRGRFGSALSRRLGLTPRKEAGHA